MINFLKMFSYWLIFMLIQCYMQTKGWSLGELKNFGAMLVIYILVEKYEEIRRLKKEIAELKK